MSRTRTTGLVLIAAGILELGLFLYGVTRRSYLALALPVTAAMATVTALTLWVGWTMLTMDEEEAELDILSST